MTFRLARRTQRVVRELLVVLSFLTIQRPGPQFHVDKKGRVSYAQTDMLIHVVNNQTNSILDVDR